MNTENQTSSKYQRYDEAFKRSAVELWLQGGRSVQQIAAELGISTQSLKQWKKQLAALPATGLGQRCVCQPPGRFAQRPAQPGIARLGDAAALLALARTPFARTQPQIAGDLPPVFEPLRITHFAGDDLLGQFAQSFGARLAALPLDLRGLFGQEFMQGRSGTLKWRQQLHEPAGDFQMRPGARAEPAAFEPVTGQIRLRLADFEQQSPQVRQPIPDFHQQSQDFRCESPPLGHESRPVGDQSPLFPRSSCQPNVTGSAPPLTSKRDWPCPDCVDRRSVIASGTEEEISL